MRTSQGGRTNAFRANPSGGVAPMLIQPRKRFSCEPSRGVRTVRTPEWGSHASPTVGFARTRFVRTPSGGSHANLPGGFARTRFVRTPPGGSHRCSYSRGNVFRASPPEGFARCEPPVEVRTKFDANPSARFAPCEPHNGARIKLRANPTLGFALCEPHRGVRVRGGGRTKFNASPIVGLAWCEPRVGVHMKFHASLHGGFAPSMRTPR